MGVCPVACTTSRSGREEPTHRPIVDPEIRRPFGRAPVEDERSAWMEPASLGRSGQVRRTECDKLACIDDAGPIRKVGGESQVVRDENVRQSLVLVELLQ